MKLNDLVPTLGLCKKIPAGWFADSAFVWKNCLESLSPEPRVVERDIYDTYQWLCPAPTLDEICHVIDGLAKIDYESQTIESCQFECNGEPLHVDIEYHYDETTTDAALRLWLKLNGTADDDNKDPYFSLDTSLKYLGLALAAMVTYMAEYRKP